MSKLVRVIIYEGDEDEIQQHLRTVNNGPVPLNGCYDLGNYCISSMVTKAENIPCCRCNSLTNSCTTMCFKCQMDAEIAENSALNL